MVVLSSSRDDWVVRIMLNVSVWTSVRLCYYRRDVNPDSIIEGMVVDNQRYTEGEG